MGIARDKERNRDGEEGRMKADTQRTHTLEPYSKWKITHTKR